MTSFYLTEAIGSFFLKWVTYNKFKGLEEEVCYFKTSFFPQLFEVCYRLFSHFLRQEEPLLQSTEFLSTVSI